MEQQVGGILRLKASGSAVLGRIDQGEISASQSRQSDVVVGEDGLVRPRWAMRTEAMTRYYDDEWGVPKWEDAQVFRILSLLILQAGLFWGSTLGRADELADLMCGLDPVEVARLSGAEVDALVVNPQMIRNGRKLRAIVNNAQVLQDWDVGLAELVWSFQPTDTPRPMNQDEVPLESPESAALARALKARGFVFVGPRICYSLFQCIGVVDTNLVGTHRRGTSGLWASDGTRLADRAPVDVPAPAGVRPESGEEDGFSAA